MMFVEFYTKISDFVLIGQKRGSHKQLLNFTVRGQIRNQNNLHLVRSMLNREKPNDFKVFVKWKTEVPRYNLITPLVFSNLSSDSKIQ
jgi:hypothetical protein